MDNSRCVCDYPTPDQEGPDGLRRPGRGAPLPGDALTPVHESLARLAAENPAALAVASGAARLTYAQLDRAAGRVAAALAAVGVGRGSRVALLAEPSAEAVVGVLGIVRSAAAYVPVDPAEPDARVAAILADARVAAAVVTAATGARLDGAALPVVVVGDPTGAADRDPVPQAAPPPRVDACDPAYLIYTSGSTGEPKGVLVEHGSLAASTAARRAVYPGPAVFLLLSRLAFDSSVAGLWGTLTSGGTLVVASADDLRDAERLLGLVERYAVTRTLCTPSLYGVLLDQAERQRAARLSSLETVVVAGEELPETLVARHFAVLPGVALVNEYGPTEATVWATYHRFAGAGPVRIGRPVPGARLYVLDDRLRPVPPGADGELYVGGAGVARGYFRRPEATARAFLDDPFAGGGARMYRTGDVVRWDAGALEFLGRRDDQVKIRGHRVEPGAVAAGLRRISCVHEAVVLPDSERSRLVAFVVASGGATPASLRRRAGEQLPPAMLPARIHVMERLPLNANGKVDRDRLRQLADDAGTRERAGADAPAIGDRLVRQVAAAWSEVLEIADVPVDANFFDLGGHSLATFKLQEALHRHAGVRPPIVALFQHTTVTSQAELIRATAGSPVPDAAAPAPVPPGDTPTQHRTREGADT